LIQHPLNDLGIELLVTGMGAKAAVIQDLQVWAIRRSDPSVIARLIIVALSENLPPDLREDEYPDLNIRLLASAELVKSLPSNDPIG